MKPIWACLVLLFLGCKEKEKKKPWWDASFHHDVNPCDDPPPTEREVLMGYQDVCGPREAARIKASVDEWKRKQAELHEAGCGDAWVQNPDGTTCRLVR